MPVAKLVIVKSISFRGGQEEFSNGYHFLVDNTNDSTLNDLINALVPHEKTIHAASVLYKRAYAGPVGGAATVYNDALTGAGGQTASNVHPEVCVLAQARISRKRILAKYFHTGYVEGLGGTGDAGFSQPISAGQAAFFTKLLDGTLPGSAKTCAPDGTVPTNPWTIDPYLRTHQFKARGPRPLPAPVIP